MRMSILLAALALVGAAPVPAPAPAKDPKAEVITGADWLRRPTQSEIAAVWPAGLRDRGRALIRCRVNVSGLLEACTVVSETPKGQGIGDAALLLAPTFVMRPATRDGHAVPGIVQVPINFDLGGGGLPNGEIFQSLLHPLWLQAPTYAQMQAAAPTAPGAVPGRVSLRCTVKASGALYDCLTLAEQPQFKGLSRAARDLTPRFRALVDPATLGPHKIEATVAFDFEPPVDGPRYLSTQDWRLRSDAPQDLSVFPAKAKRDGLKTGRAMLDCIIQHDGSLAGCAVESEEPAGEDFGAGALRLAGYMTFGAWTQDGHPTDGAHVRIPVRLNAGDDTPPAH